MSNLMHKHAHDSWWAGRAVPAWAVLALVTWQFQVSRSQGAGDAEKTRDAERAGPRAVREERLWNIADQPFRYRLGRSNGRPWTDEVTLEPGKHQTIRAPLRGDESELEGVTGHGGRYLSISYPVMGGRMHLHLPVRSGKDAVMPNWFHVKDSNGFSQLIHAADVDQAKARQEELQNEKPLTPAEIEKIKKVLRANWVFYEN